MKQLMEQLVIDTASFYNANNRATSQYGCVYVGKGKKRCAVGRIMSKKTLSILLEKKMNESDIGCVLSECGNDILKPKWSPLLEQEEGAEFIKGIQELHDQDQHWNSEGISEEGLAFLSVLCEENGLDDERVLSDVRSKLDA